MPLILFVSCWLQNCLTNIFAFELFQTQHKTPGQVMLEVDFTSGPSQNAAHVRLTKTAQNCLRMNEVSSRCLLGLDPWNLCPFLSLSLPLMSSMTRSLFAVDRCRLLITVSALISLKQLNLV